MDISAVTKMEPQKLLLIVGGGVAAGLLWRKMANRGSAPAATPTAVVAEDGLPIGQFAPNGADRRDTFGSSINLPGAGYVFRDPATGRRYFADEDGNITPLDSVTADGPATPPPTEGGNVYIPTLSEALRQSQINNDAGQAWWSSLTEAQRAGFKAQNPGVTVPN